MCTATNTYFLTELISALFAVASRHPVHRTSVELMEDARDRRLQRLMNAEKFGQLDMQEMPSDLTKSLSSGSGGSGGDSKEFPSSSSSGGLGVFSMLMEPTRPPPTTTTTAVTTTTPSRPVVPPGATGATATTVGPSPRAAPRFAPGVSAYYTAMQSLSDDSSLAAEFEAELRSAFDPSTSPVGEFPLASAMGRSVSSHAEQLQGSDSFHRSSSRSNQFGFSALEPPTAVSGNAVIDSSMPRPHAHGDVFTNNDVKLLMRLLVKVTK
jgi:hypothetical protein